MRYIKKYFSLKRISLLLFQFNENEPIKYDAGCNFNVEVLKEKKVVKYKVWIKNELAHESTVYFDSLLLNTFKFKKPYLLIGNCFTNEKFRGQNIYPFVLNKIAKDYNNLERVYVLVNPENIPSIKGIKKAGFILLNKLFTYRFFIFHFNKMKS